MEELILKLGLQFRNIVQHSDGRWSCKLLHDFGGTDEFWGESAIEALTLANDHVDSFDE